MCKSLYIVSNSGVAGVCGVAISSDSGATFTKHKINGVNATRYGACPTDTTFYLAIGEFPTNNTITQLPDGSKILHRLSFNHAIVEKNGKKYVKVLNKRELHLVTHNHQHHRR